MRAHDVIAKRLILPRSRFAEISNTSGLFPFPEAKKELILKIGKTGPEISTTSSVKWLEKTLPEPS